MTFREMSLRVFAGQPIPQVLFQPLVVFHLVAGQGAAGWTAVPYRVERVAVGVAVISQHARAAGVVACVPKYSEP